MPARPLAQRAHARPERGPELAEALRGARAQASRQALPARGREPASRERSESRRGRSRRRRRPAGLRRGGADRWRTCVRGPGPAEGRRPALPACRSRRATSRPPSSSRPCAASVDSFDPPVGSSLGPVVTGPRVRRMIPRSRAREPIEARLRSHDRFHLCSDANAPVAPPPHPAGASGSFPYHKSFCHSILRHERRWRPSCLSPHTNRPPSLCPGSPGDGAHRPKRLRPTRDHLERHRRNRTVRRATR